MNKYDKYNSLVGSSGSVKDILDSDETILWEGKPKKNAYILNSIVGMIPIVLIWLLFDGFFIFMIFFTGAVEEMPIPLICGLVVFFLFHLIPVWIWIGKFFTSYRKWKMTEYVVTDKRILFKSGMISASYESLYYTEIINVKYHVGVIDRLTHVGDIIFSTKGNSNNAILDIENSNEVYLKVEKIVRDIQTDIQYPNNLRPNENNGYQTKYTPKE